MTVIHGFELLEEREVPELNIRARYFRHLKTGAELLSLENDDENKVFGITFRTPPEDSTGVPHIMEHSVLCGSEKYPLKEPFVELIKGSLQTFLNAFTYPDKTCYPVASQNLQDFYNLIDVYMDAVLHPLIPAETLQQEGWHYELEDPEEPMRFKGVVFNEMKGAYSSPDSILVRFTQQELFPDNTYGVDSGGDPAEIPNLTYEKFKGFHETFYHPSNARIYFYGDDPADERLRLMDVYLQAFEPRAVDSQVSLQAQFDEPRQVRIPYDAGEDGSRKSMITVSWLLPEIEAPEPRLGLLILNHILIGTPAAPLRKALIESGLGDDLAGVGLENELRQMYFSTGLKGIESDDAGKVENLILDTLRALVEDGIDPGTISASLNTIEFLLRENNTGSFPRGLLLMLRSLNNWLYERNPIEPLAFEGPLEGIKGRQEHEPYFEHLIERYLLNNRHRVTVLLEPDRELRQRREAAERERLEQVRAAMSPEEVRGVIENTRTLKLRQETPDPPEALEKIPSLELADIDPEIKKIPLAVSRLGDTPLLYHDLFTNGIVYLDLGLNLHALPQEYLPYTNLFGRALFEMGTESQDYVKLSQRIGQTTGGIRPRAFTSVVPGQAESAAWLFLRGKSTVEQAGDLLDILHDVLLTVNLDQRERFRQMVLEEKAGLEAGLVPGGHRMVNARLRAQYSEADWAAEQMSGIEYLFFLRKLAEAVDADWPGVVEGLSAVREHLLDRTNLLVNVTLDADHWQAVQPQVDAFLDSLPSGAGQLHSWTPIWTPGFEGLTIPAQVNYVGKGADLYKLGYDLDGSIFVIQKYLRTTWLWEKVRVQGGAYGGFCLFDHHSGLFTYLSYRDPNLLGTLENYDKTGEFLRRVEISRDELAKSIIGAIGEMDAYQLPDAKGYSSMLRYLIGDTDAKRQRRREQILSASEQDFHAFADVLDGVREAGTVVVLGSQEMIQEANAARSGWLEVKRVL